MPTDNLIPKNKNQKKCMESIFLKNNEDFKYLVNASRMREKKYRAGFFILTNQRLIFAEEKGLIGKSYDVTLSLEHENIVNVSFAGSVVKTISVLDKEQNTWNFIFKFGLSKDEIIHTLKNLVKERVDVIEKEKQKSRIQYVMDFSFLKNEMEKGGLVLTTIKCPSCAGMVDMPKDGQTFQCKYCDSTINAVDIYEKIKNMIS